ncbi:hypothetical protein [Microbacterium sp. ZOR0019]|uniref:hypothetical protein n=1 Tax=Microbacterium sp. ZOR0019 TaxID=1339233 RepID=UPI0006464115|nr:hypothetical protein [Microbacterium sp. ZOR0019]
MATEDEEKSPFTRPGFIISAGLVVALVVVGVIVGISVAQKPDPTASPQPTASEPAPSTAPTPTEGDAGGASVCGLSGEVLEGTLTNVPDVDEWVYQGTTAYPTSTKYGPGMTAPEGYRYCFQHSPEGAAFMAATAIAQGGDPTVNAAWVNYVVPEGPYRDQLLSSAGQGGTTQGIRMDVRGVRLLSYTGDTARVDLGISGASQGKTINASVVYELVWQDGDWKLNAETPTPFDFAAIPNLSSYTPWGP